MQSEENKLEVNQIEEYLDRRKIIVLPFRLAKNFLEKCASNAREMLELPKDSVIRRVWIDNERDSFMFLVCSWSYDKVESGQAPNEEIL